MFPLCSSSLTSFVRHICILQAVKPPLMVGVPELLPAGPIGLLWLCWKVNPIWTFYSLFVYFLVALRKKGKGACLIFIIASLFCISSWIWLSLHLSYLVGFFSRHMTYFCPARVIIFWIRVLNSLSCWDWCIGESWIRVPNSSLLHLRSFAWRVHYSRVGLDQPVLGHQEFGSQASAMSVCPILILLFWL